ncbi:MAG: mevalonate kinase [Chloroflexi bacterium]|nr:MAG: mevalonate kinase [Chloroflexota bacterium]RLC80742.1 MAG: mevalonate kinase [Chloroflexota bacterium]HEY73364.1 mevalonate kinase [Thermoflexia bacterium]
MATRLIKSSAPGKIILFGEHAVVYERAAIAVPVTQVRATATVEPAPAGSGLTLVASDLDRSVRLAVAPEGDPLAVAARLALAHLSAPEPDGVLTINSTIPIASGMGSGAAVSTALVRGLAGFLGHALRPAEVSEIVFEVEKIHHGTPSGIDNTVVAYEQPVYFVRGRPVEQLAVGQPFTLLIADTGTPSPTGKIVAQVRWARQREPARYDALFDQIGDIADEARRAIESGDVDALGPLMDDNHELLIELGVSSPRLDDLVEAARFAGAMGAKLSGAGQGGNTIALVEDYLAEEVAEELRETGAVEVIRTNVR